MTCNKILFNVVQFVHLFIYLFVLSAWMCKSTAIFNILILLPLIYLSQITPWCLPNMVKEILCKVKNQALSEKLNNSSFTKAQNSIGKYSKQNPISYQGILILSYVTCVISLYCRGAIV
jgi:hypothetical protein